MLDRLKDHLVDNWTQAWRWWSVQLHVIGTLLGTLLVMVPAMPAEVQAMVPLQYRVIAVGLWAALGLAARLFKQKPGAGQ